MKTHNYRPGFALGTIAGSSCLGMLIPPSVLMIVWGILTEQSIGRLFLAGVLPGALLALAFIAYIVAVAILRPETVGEGRARAAAAVPGTADTALPARQILASLLGVGGIILSVLGGIWWGFFTPTEGAGAGGALALLLAIAKGMRWREFVSAIYSVGQTAAPIMILLLMAALYSRTLAMTGVTSAIREFFVASGLGPFTVLAIILAVWFVLGMIIDSISIMLLTVPIVEPVAMAFGFDQLSFARLFVSFGATTSEAPPVPPSLLQHSGSLYFTRPTLADYIKARGDLTRAASEVFRLAEEGVLSVNINRRLPLDRVAEAHEALESGETTGSTILLP